MIRKIIHIDEEKCNGCGLCATACHEGAIDIINGKAKLVRENFCDGFGDCLPGCPTGAITFEEREAPAYDEMAVQENKKKKELQEKMKHLHEGGCPGSRMRMLEQPETAESVSSAPVQPVSRLRNWPVQIKLAPIHAPYFAGAKLLIAADCTAYAYANFHQEFMRGKVTLIGCPKLDAVDYSEKLTEILRNNDIQSVTILRMEVPCCGGLEMAAKRHCRPAESSFRGRWSPSPLMVKFWIKQIERNSRWNIKCFVFSASRQRPAPAVSEKREYAASPPMSHSFRTS